MKRFLLLVLLLCGFGILGCGYSTRSALPSSWRTIYVPAFENKINYTAENRRNLYVPLLEVKVRQGIVSRFQYDGGLKIAKEENADLVLSGELINYDRGALRYDDNNNVQEYRIYITVNLKLTNTADGKIEWEEKGFSGEATYFLSGPHAKSESAALEDAVTDLSRRVVERTIENW